MSRWNGEENHGKSIFSYETFCKGESEEEQSYPVPKLKNAVDIDILKSWYKSILKTP